MKLPDKVYELLKWLVLIVLPALTTLYGTLAPVYGFQDADKILTAMTAVTTCLGTIIGVSTANYRSNSNE